MLQYDELLGQYLDENGTVYEGLVEVDVDTNEAKKVRNEFEEEQQQNQLVAVHNTIVKLEQQLDLLKKQEETVKAKLLKSMQDNGVWQFKVGNMTISRKKEHTRTTLDQKRFKADMPEIAKQYEKTTLIGESLSINIKEEQKDEF